MIGNKGNDKQQNTNVTTIKNPRKQANNAKKHQKNQKK